MPSDIRSIQSPDRKPAHSDRRESLGARLRQERERRKISIASIADSTKILGALLEGLENDDVSRWPIGFYRRAFLRSYATAIGLDPDATWRQFAERFPEPEEPVVTASEGSRRARLRLTLADRATWFVGGPLLDRLPPRGAAVAFDLTIIGSVAIVAFVVIGLFWLPLAAGAVLYYCGGILALGNTPGVCLFAPLPQRQIEPQIAQMKPQIAQMKPQIAQTKPQMAPIEPQMTPMKPQR
jgi:transcriptional regulator with XRE-family HTH domain